MKSIFQDSFQDELIEMIKKGDIESFKKLEFFQDDCNVRLRYGRTLRPFSQKNPNEHYFCPKSPTLFMFVILCEQDEILKHLIDNYQPKFDYSVQGFNSVQLSVIIKDHKCFNLIKDHIFDWNLYFFHNSTNLLHLAITYSNFETIKLVLSIIPNEFLNSKSQTGLSPISLLPKSENYEIIANFLINQGIIDDR